MVTVYNKFTTTVTSVSKGQKYLYHVRTYLCLPPTFAASYKLPRIFPTRDSVKSLSNIAFAGQQRWIFLLTNGKSHTISGYKEGEIYRYMQCFGCYIAESIPSQPVRAQKKIRRKKMGRRKKNISAMKAQLMTQMSFNSKPPEKKSQPYFTTSTGAYHVI